MNPTVYFLVGERSLEEITRTLAENRITLIPDTRVTTEELPRADQDQSDGRSHVDILGSLELSGYEFGFTLRHPPAKDTQLQVDLGGEKTENAVELIESLAELFPTDDPHLPQKLEAHWKASNMRSLVSCWLMACLGITTLFFAVYGAFQFLTKN